VGDIGISGQRTASRHFGHSKTPRADEPDDGLLAVYCDDIGKERIMMKHFFVK